MHPAAAIAARAAGETWRETLAARQAAARAAAEVLAAHPGFQPPPLPPDREPVFWIFSPAWEAEAWEGAPRWAVAMALAAEGVPLSVGPIGRPLHRRMGRWGKGFRCPSAEDRCRRETVLALPPGPDSGFMEGLREAVERVYRARRALRAWAAGRPGLSSATGRSAASPRA